MVRRRAVAGALCLFAFGAGIPARAQQQSLGHKVLGTLGLRAGAQEAPGLYVGDLAAFYFSDQLRDRTGARVPLDLQADVFSNVVGVSFVAKVRSATHVGLGVSVPTTAVHVGSEVLATRIDELGLGDVYVQPLKLGWKLDRVDLVVGYGFYAPTGQFEPEGLVGLGVGRWSHEVSAGATAYVGQDKVWTASALSSVLWNRPNGAIDLNRGEMIQLQGGVGRRFLGQLEAGLTGFALWQVTDDTGSVLPQALQGARERDFGLGGEVGLLIPELRGKVTVRYSRDFAARARPEGELVLLSLVIQGWRPQTRPEAGAL